MANVVSDYVLDNGLTSLKNLADKLYICISDPSSFSDATTTLALGNKNFGAGNVFTAVAAGAPNGRQVSSVAISDGSITTTGTAAKWAIVDSVNSRLLVNGSLAASQAVTSGNTFTLASFSIRLPGQ